MNGNEMLAEQKILTIVEQYKSKHGATAHMSVKPVFLVGQLMEMALGVESPGYGAVPEIVKRLDAENAAWQKGSLHNVSCAVLRHAGDIAAQSGPDEQAARAFYRAETPEVIHKIDASSRPEVNGTAQPAGLWDNLDPDDSFAAAPYEEVNHPAHYNDHPTGVECISIIEHMPLNVGTAMKYLWRAGLKPTAGTEADLKKALWYVQRQIGLITGTNPTVTEDIARNIAPESTDGDK